MEDRSLSVLDFQAVERYDSSFHMHAQRQRQSSFEDELFFEF